jgi:WD40 repeat protein/serine/threonine protein kinase
MNHQRWERIEDLLQRALDLEPAQRSSFLDRNCGSDHLLRSEIEHLLDNETEAASFMESPAAVCVSAHIIDASPAPPARISHYHVESRVGGGGMGEVYKARDETLQRIVALKMLPSEFTSDLERVRRFEQEAFAASRLNHPNIITIFEITQANGVHFIAEEFVEGQTLRQMLTDPQTQNPQKLAIERALDIAIQIAGAIKAAHTAWIIHRDIKPENIMVREDGLVKVLDFGIAKLNEDGSGDQEIPPVREEGLIHLASSANQLTIPGMIMGTASYMSPEQARGENLDGRADIFSLGVLLYEMVTGERPFSGLTRAGGLQASERVDEIMSRNARLRQLPAELQRIIRRMLRRNRDERYASASDLLDDLHRLKRRLQNRTARRIVGLSALAAVVAVTVTGITALLSVSEVWDEKILSDGHRAAVRRAVFSPDGRLLISVGEDHQVIVWDFARRERVKSLTDHTGVVNAVSFSPDGKWFATASEDQTVIIWDAVRLELATILREHGAPVRTLSFSPFGHRLATSSSYNGKALTIIWDTDTWRKVRTLPFGQSFGNLVFLKDNRGLVENSGRIWDLDTVDFKDERADPFGNWIAVSPDGRRWAAVDSKGKVKLVDREQPNDITIQPTHHDHGRSVDFSPDGRWLATAAERVVLWDATTFTKVVPLEYDSVVWSVAFSPDSRWLVSTHGDGAILIWDVAQRELAANLKQHSGGVRAVTFSPDGKRLVSASEDHAVIVWNVDGSYKEAVLTGHQTRVTAVTFSPDGNWLASADQDGVLIQWDLANRTPHRKIKPPEGAYAYCLAISPDGQHVALTNAIYELETGSPLSIPWSHVYSAVFTTEGKLIGARDDGQIILVDAKKWQTIELQKWSDTALVTLSLSSDGRHLVTGEDGKTVRLGTVEPLRQTAVIGQHEARIKAVAFSPDGQRIASAGDDKLIKLWNVTDRKLISVIGTHSSPVYAIAFSPDGQRLVSGEHDRSVRIYTRHRQLWGFHLD